MPEPVQQPIEPPPSSDLQFRRAVPIADEASIRRCVACKSPIQATYYHAAGQTVCPDCAKRIQDGQQAPPAVSLGKAFLYGSGAAFAGFVIYSLVQVILNWEVALITILIGYMVGKAIRYASGGLGGRPQQILAVALTYFAITASYIPTFIVAAVKSAHSQAEKSGNSSASQPGGQGAGQAAGDGKAAPSFGQAVVILIGIALAAPFFSLTQGASGLLTLLIIFFGLSRAWQLTGRSNILVMGPYESSPGSV